MDSSKLVQQKGVKIVHVNVRSLFKKLDQFSLLFRNLDFVLCSETWLNDKFNDDMLYVPGMKLYRNDRCNADPALIADLKVPKRGGGVCIYAKDKWVPYIQVIPVGTKITENYEILTVSVDKPGFRKMLVTCVYRPPKGDKVSLISFLEELTQMREYIAYEKWILGDFNIDYIERGSAIMWAKTIYKSDYSDII